MGRNNKVRWFGANILSRETIEVVGRSVADNEETDFRMSIPKYYEGACFKLPAGGLRMSLHEVQCKSLLYKLCRREVRFIIN
jgi:hypothetical protein